MKLITNLGVVDSDKLEDFVKQLPDEHPEQLEKAIPHDWIMQFSGTPLYEKALQAVKAKLEAQYAWQPFYASEISYRERNKWSADRREKYEEKRSAERAKLIDADTVAERKMKDLEMQLIDHKIAQAKNLNKASLENHPIQQTSDTIEQNVQSTEGLEELNKSLLEENECRNTGQVSAGGIDNLVGYVSVHADLVRARAGEHGEELVKTYTAIRNAYEKKFGAGSWKKIKVSKEAKESEAKPEKLPFGAKKKLGPEEHERYTEAKKRLAGKLGMPKEGWGLYGRTILGGLKAKEKKVEKSLEPSEILGAYLAKSVDQAALKSTQLVHDTSKGAKGREQAEIAFQGISENHLQSAREKYTRPAYRQVDGRPDSQRAAMAHEHAIAVSKLTKSSDIVVGLGIPPPSDQIASLMKSHIDLCPDGSPHMTREQILLYQQRQCPACKMTLHKSLAVCPTCGHGAGLYVEENILPTIRIGSGPGPRLRPVRVKDIHCPNGMLPVE